MSDPSPAEPDTKEHDRQERWPWWLYLTIGFFALGLAAAALGVRTCL